MDTLTDPNVFDTSVIHNKINHIGEDVLEDILCNNEAYIDYVSRVKTILDRLSSGGILLVFIKKVENSECFVKKNFAPII